MSSGWWNPGTYLDGVVLVSLWWFISRLRRPRCFLSG
jgi:hypothetical protein